MTLHTLRISLISGLAGTAMLAAGCSSSAEDSSETSSAVARSALEFPTAPLRCGLFQEFQYPAESYDLVATDNADGSIRLKGTFWRSWSPDGFSQQCSEPKAAPEIAITVDAVARPRLDGDAIVLDFGNDATASFDGTVERLDPSTTSTSCQATNVKGSGKVAFSKLVVRRDDSAALKVTFADIRIADRGTLPAEFGGVVDGTFVVQHGDRILDPLGGSQPAPFGGTCYPVRVPAANGDRTEANKQDEDRFGAFYAALRDRATHASAVDTPTKSNLKPSVEAVEDCSQLTRHNFCYCTGSSCHDD